MYENGRYAIFNIYNICNSLHQCKSPFPLLFGICIICIYMIYDVIYLMICTSQYTLLAKYKLIKLPCRSKIYLKFNKAT